MNRVETLMESAVADGVFPGAALLFARENEILHQNCYGFAASVPKRIPLHKDTYFDVASLTKVIATTAVAMRLYERSSLDLERPIRELLPEFEASPYAQVTIRQLLEHRSGMPDYRPYFEKFSPKTVDASNRQEVLASILNLIADEKPAAPIGEKRIYSDLGFICLGEALERVTGLSLRELFETEVSSPLGLNQSLYSPLRPDPTDPSLIACTEHDPWRDRLLCGEVHDENAFVLGGAAGHSGIFTTLADCHMFAKELVAAAEGQSSWLRQKTIERFLGSEHPHALGWDRPAPSNSQAGAYFGSTAVGHLGFTGCSLWIDLEKKIIAILLTNRVHPNRTNERIKEFRPRIHDTLFQHYIHT